MQIAYGTSGIPWVRSLEGVEVLESGIGELKATKSEDELVLEAMANGIAGITGGNLSLMIVILIWLSAVASAFVDNIPFAATMVPVISSLSATMGVDLNTLAWTLSMGTDIGGSATPIGASANVAGTAIAAREGHPISWGRYCKYSAPAAVIVVAISMAVILLRY